MKKMRVAVLLGGLSTERQVSIASGMQVVAALRRKGHDVVAVDAAFGILNSAGEASCGAITIDPSEPSSGAPAGSIDIFRILTSPELSEIDVFFLALHGGAGENGTVQAMLQAAGHKYTGSGPLGSAIAMNKDVSKRLFVEAGIRTPAWLMDPASDSDILRKVGYPLVVKPCSQGSTVGLSIVHSPDDLNAALMLARGYDRDVMLEQFIPGRELTVGVVEMLPLSVGEIVLGSSGIFDYEAKYQGATVEVFPAQVTPEIASKAKEIAVRAHSALRLQDYSRSDFRLDKSGNLWCLELNTLPGMTKNSLLPKSAAASGLAFDDLCERLCLLGVQAVRQ